MLFHGQTVYFSIQELARIWRCTSRQVQAAIDGEDGVVRWAVSRQETNAVRGRTTPYKNIKTRVAEEAVIRLYREKIWPAKTFRNSPLDESDVPTPREFEQIVWLLETRSLRTRECRKDAERENIAHAYQILWSKRCRITSERVFRFFALLSFREEIAYPDEVATDSDCLSYANNKTAFVETRSDRLLARFSECAETRSERLLTSCKCEKCKEINAS